MSMEFSIYVGPYLHVVGAQWEDIEPLLQWFQEGRGELGNGEDWDTLVPTQFIPGINRAMMFDRSVSTGEWPMTEKTITRELGNFLVWSRYKKAEKVLGGISGCKWHSRWGIVPCMS